MKIVYGTSGTTPSIPTFETQVSQREKRMRQKTYLIMTENFPNLMKGTDIHIQETQRVPNKINLNRLTPRYIIIKMEKVKDRILKSSREKPLCTRDPV